MRACASVVVSLALFSLALAGDDSIHAQDEFKQSSEAVSPIEFTKEEQMSFMQVEAAVGEEAFKGASNYIMDIIKSAGTAPDCAELAERLRRKENILMNHLSKMQGPRLSKTKLWLQRLPFDLREQCRNQKKEIKAATEESKADDAAQSTPRPHIGSHPSFPSPKLPATTASRMSSRGKWPRMPSGPPAATILQRRNQRHPDQEFFEAFGADVQKIVKKHKLQEHVRKARKNPPEVHNALISEFFSHVLLGVKAEDEIGGLTTKQKAAGKCIQGIVTVAPPAFCWKPDTRNHQVPHCKSGWFKHMAECFQGCDSGYYWVAGGTCWKYCASGYSDHGATCYKGIFDWYGKSHYWASRKTMFHDEAICHSDQYKSGALCYKKCSTWGVLPNSLQDCGFDGCSPSPEQCASTILNMIINIAFSIAAMVALFGSGGAAAPLVAAGGSLLKNMGKNGVKAMAKSVVQGVLRSGTSKFSKVAFMQSAKKFTKKWVVGQAKSKTKLNAVRSLCHATAHGFYDALTPDPKNFNAAKLDPTGISSAVTSCEDGKGESMGCKRSIVAAMNTFDPTGLLGVASAFMHDTCEAHTAPFVSAWFTKIGKGCISGYTAHGSLDPYECEAKCADVDCRYFSRPAGAGTGKAGCWTTKSTDPVHGSCNEDIWKETAVDLNFNDQYKSNGKGCISNWSTMPGGKITAAECKRKAMAKGAKHFTRPAGKTGRESCWYTTSGHKHGSCNEDVWSKR